MTARLLRSGRRGVVVLALLLPDLLLGQEQTPPLSAGRVAFETIGGAYAGIAGFFIGRYATQSLAGAMGAEHETTLKHVGLIGGAIGGTLATAGAVYAIGTMGEQTGNFRETAIGTGAGFVVAFALAKALIGPDVRPQAGQSTKARWVTVNALALLPAVGATIAFNSTRRYK